MAIVITRTVVLPGLMLAYALVVILGRPATAAGALLLFGCALLLAATLFGRNTVDAFVGDRLRAIDVRPLTVTGVDRHAGRPPSWPDSGFRNIWRRHEGRLREAV